MKWKSPVSTSPNTAKKATQLNAKVGEPHGGWRKSPAVFVFYRSKRRKQSVIVFKTYKNFREVLDCGSLLPLFDRMQTDEKAAGGLPQSKRYRAFGLARMRVTAVVFLTVLAGF